MNFKLYSVLNIWEANIDDKRRHQRNVQIYIGKSGTFVGNSEEVKGLRKWQDNINKKEWIVTTTNSEKDVQSQHFINKDWHNHTQTHIEKNKCTTLSKSTFENINE